MEFRFTKGTKELGMMNDFLTFIQKFWKVEQEDSYWDGMIDSANGLLEKYNDNNLTALLVGFVEAKEKDYCDLTGRTRRPATLKWEKVKG